MRDTMNYLAVKDLRDGMGNWLSEMSWDYFQTGTFREEFETFSPFTAKRRFLKYIEGTRKKYGLSNIDYFIAIEPHKSGTYHVHTLMNGCAGVSDEALWEDWFKKYGRNTVEIYDPQLGASHYLTKYIVKDLCDWDIRVRKSNQLKFFFGKG
jgi:hypothetical protein